MQKIGPIGVFDSGFGGLTVLKSLTEQLPAYDYLYLGDNARVPYGNRSFETVYAFTLECIKALFAHDCPLVIVACNTASAKALRNIQQNDLPKIAPNRKVLGVIRPTTEDAAQYTTSGHIGVLGTSGTVSSQSYSIEINKFFPDLKVHQQACPMWVPLVENNEHVGPGAPYFLKKYLNELLEKAPKIDAVILGCTHYPLLLDKLQAITGDKIRFVPQGPLVAQKLEEYLKRHSGIETRCSKNGRRRFLTTDDPAVFEEKAGVFYGASVQAEHIDLMDIRFESAY